MKNPLANLRRYTGVALYRLVRAFWPELGLTKEEVLRGMSELGRKLERAHKENAEWRERCLSAERAMSYEVKNALKSALQRHDEKYHTMLGWWP